MMGQLQMVVMIKKSGRKKRFLFNQSVKSMKMASETVSVEM